MFSLHVRLIAHALNLFRTGTAELTTQEWDLLKILINHLHKLTVHSFYVAHAPTKHLQNLKENLLMKLLLLKICKPFFCTISVDRKHDVDRAIQSSGKLSTS